MPPPRRTHHAPPRFSIIPSGGIPPLLLFTLFTFSKSGSRVNKVFRPPALFTFHAPLFTLEAPPLGSPYLRTQFLHPIEKDGRSVTR